MPNATARAMTSATRLRMRGLILPLSGPQRKLLCRFRIAARRVRDLFPRRCGLARRLLSVTCPNFLGLPPTKRADNISGMNRPCADVDSTSLEKVREYEIEEARNIQQAMVPAGPLRARGLEFACKFLPVSEVGGDFLDYFWLMDHRLACYLGDVVGKGLPAAMYAALAVGTLRGIHKTGVPTSSVLELFNERLAMRPVPRRFCSVQYAVFDPLTGELLYANAGLPR